jgi:hypothetical protein
MHQGFGDEKGMVPASTRRLATRLTPPASDHQVLSLPGWVVFEGCRLVCGSYLCQTQARVPPEFKE